jgi:hypothetical protein
VASNLVRKLPLRFACRKTTSGKVAMSLTTNRKGSQKQELTLHAQSRAKRCVEHGLPATLFFLFGDLYPLSRTIPHAMLIGARTDIIESWTSRRIEPDETSQ